MTREFFNRQFAALVAAYTIAQKLSDVSQDVYWEMLKDLPEDKFAHAVKHCLATCKFFPTISELGEEALPAITFHPYNPRLYEPERKITWNEQVEIEKRQERNPLQIEEPEPPRTALTDEQKYGKRYPDGTTDYARDYLTRIWRIQDSKNFKSINNPDWYSM